VCVYVCDDVTCSSADCENSTVHVRAEWEASEFMTLQFNNRSLDQSDETDKEKTANLWKRIPVVIGDSSDF